MPAGPSTADRYDARTKTVRETGGDDTWFNIACAGTAIAKLHLLRHTWAADRDGAHPTTVDQRQALLKLLAADYCGTGKAFTVEGQPLAYSFDQRWARAVDWNGAASVDAVWDANHAVCLRTPRLADRFPVRADAASSHP